MSAPLTPKQVVTRTGYCYEEIRRACSLYWTSGGAQGLENQRRTPTAHIRIPEHAVGRWMRGEAPANRPAERTSRTGVRA